MAPFSTSWLRESDGELTKVKFLQGIRYTPISATGAPVGTWLQIHDRLREWTRIEHERHRSPSEAIIDCHCVKSAAMVGQAVGYDAGKMHQRSQAVYDR